MLIRQKILLSFLAVALLIGGLGGLAFEHEMRQADVIARREAAAIAETFSVFVVKEHEAALGTAGNGNAVALQKHIQEFKSLHNRDLVIVESRKRIVADAVPREIGQTYSHDPHNEVGMTLQDGVARTFTETSEAYPRGIKLLVLPLKMDADRRIGAIILEYSPLYEDVLSSTRRNAFRFLYLYLGALVLSTGIGYGVSRKLSQPLNFLKNAAERVAEGDLSVAVPVESYDEIGSLARSFNRMTENLKQSRDEILHANEVLEAESRLRRDKEEALSRSEQKFRTLFENATDGLFILDPSGRFIDVNRTAHERLGYTKEAMLGMHIADLNVPEFNKFLPERMEKIRSGQAVVFESAHRKKDGSAMPVEVNARSIEFDGKQALFSIIRDITERKQAERVLRESEENYRELVESVNSIVLRWTPDGHIVFINDFGRKFFGFEPGELSGRPLLGVIIPEIDSTGRDMRNMVSSICAEPEEHRDNLNENVCKDGRRVWVSWTNKQLRGREGEVGEILSIGNDITEQIVVQEELRRHREELMRLVEERTTELVAANEKLRREIADRERMEAELIRAQKLESLGVLAGGIAHDFNNLLTAILGNISVALLDLDEGHAAYQELSRAERASLRAQELTQQLLTFSKGGEPVKRPTAIGELIRESAGFALRGGRVTCEFLIPDSLWLVEADEGQLVQVINNLIINADHAMPDGGTIAVRCENVTLPLPDGPALKPGPYVRIDVRDRGIGIPREFLTKIFDPYFTTKQRGSGLGLATSHSIINKHGGLITVASEPGSGTTFTIFLPASSAAAVPPKSEIGPPLSAEGRVLVMDDEKDVRETSAAMLRRLGYTVAIAADGEDAIEQYVQALRAGEKFDAVIMDLTIAGGMGGQEAIRLLLQIDPDIRAIVSSGYSNDPVMANFAEYGFTGVVSKPYRIKELGDAVHRAVRGA